MHLDDVNVFGLSFEEHLRNIDEVLERFQRYNLKLKPRKCFLFQTECEFLCKKISRDGVTISPAKLDAVKSWPVPTDKREVESILGYANYHREHVQVYAGISQCLYELTGSKAKQFQGTPDHQTAFDCLRKALLSAPCLAYPTPTDEFI